MAIKRIGVLTGGGDAPGLNPAIRSVVLKAAERGIATVGIYDGWQGLLGESPEVWELDEVTVQSWERDGGTHIGSSRTNPFSSKAGAQKVDRSDEVLANLRRLGIDALVAIGGEDTLGVAARLAKKGAPVVGLPKTIDKDLGSTEYTLGFDTSMRVCAEIIERSATPAGSHHWVQVVEVMGRHAGHLALWSGLAGGAFMTLIPEHPFDIERVVRLLDERLARGSRDRRFPRYAVVVIAEGASPAGRREVTVDGKKDEFGHMRLGGIGAWLADEIRQRTPWDARAVALGHPQRGGSPSAIDRLMGYLFGVAGVEAVERGEWGKMVSARGIAPACDFSLVALDEAVKGLNLVDVKRHYDVDHYCAARQVFGGA
ncbi:MAG: ATP-dependent 6-phosphofructokinase [Myxococcales bacterium]|nr:ATP-dependent 6-phosphofructokinase [Myxococcales bacterium]